MHSEKETINNRRTARILTVACGLLFSTFSIVYLAIFQCDVLEALHYSLAQGKTQYSPWMSSFILTGVLLLLRWVVNGWTKLRGPLYALSYFPSCLLLGVLTDVSYGVYQGEGIGLSWTWLLPLFLFGFARQFHWVGQRMSEGALINSNLFSLLALCMMTICIGNSDIHFHQELQIEKALRERDYQQARQVGFKSMDPSRNLTALRAYGMSKEGTLGEYLFNYPQLYGAEGLLIDSSDKKSLRVNADSLYVYLGNRPLEGESALSFFERICREESGNYTTLDYYLSALLLEKKLDEFVSKFDQLYTVDDRIPHYYQEALYLYGKMHPEASLTEKDEDMDQRWSDYQQLKDELTGSVGEGNFMRRRFGNTYWWYYQYY